MGVVRWGRESFSEFNMTTEVTRGEAYARPCEASESLEDPDNETSGLVTVYGRLGCNNESIKIASVV